MVQEFKARWRWRHLLTGTLIVQGLRWKEFFAWGMKMEDPFALG
jgi:hypothetical protein